MFSTILESVLLEFNLDKTIDNVGGIRKTISRINADPTYQGFTIRLDADLGSESSIVVKQTIDDFKSKLMTALGEADPTPNKEYHRWILQTYVNRGIKRWEDRGRVRRALTYYHKFKQRKKITNPDILKIKSLDELEDLIEILIEEYGDISKAEKDAKLADIAKKNSDIWEFPTCTLVSPETEEAACYFGRGTRWCTAADNYNQFKYYDKSGKLYIFIPKSPAYNGEKYQLHVNGRGTAYDIVCNEKDHELPIDEFTSDPRWADPLYKIYGIDFSGEFYKNWSKAFPEIRSTIMKLSKYEINEKFHTVEAADWVSENHHWLNRVFGFKPIVDWTNKEFERLLPYLGSKLLTKMGMESTQEIFELTEHGRDLMPSGWGDCVVIRQGAVIDIVDMVDSDSALIPLRCLKIICKHWYHFPNVNAFVGNLLRGNMANHITVADLNFIDNEVPESDQVDFTEFLGGNHDVDAPTWRGAGIQSYYNDFKKMRDEE